MRGQQAHPKYDYFMFLLMVLIECLEDRRTYISTFYEQGANFASVAKVVEAAETRIMIDSTPAALKALLQEVLDKVLEFHLA